ncbi:MAG: hypothetical protein CFE45_10380 [Burkholderiales bacterium PBB5]|nr:MAG: hypothetical protein CFE45_10380 [Burkholderiales bacterium PBB5]
MYFGGTQPTFNVECPQAEYTGICLEFGTLPLPDMMFALRGEHWLHRHPQTDRTSARSMAAPGLASRAMP